MDGILSDMKARNFGIGLLNFKIGCMISSNVFGSISRIQGERTSNDTSFGKIAKSGSKLLLNPKSLE